MILSPIRLGTRGSDLALAQAHLVKNKLNTFFPDIPIEIIPIETEGDKDLTTPLYEMGGKGVFIRDLETALLRDKIDLAVHSLKDVTSELPNELEIQTFLKAESSADCLILRDPALKIENLHAHSVFGTGSLRRKALLHYYYPQFKTIGIRGNVLTRIKKMHEQKLDGLIVSEAGIIRLGLEHLISFRFDPHIFLPAPGQGVIVLEGRKEDKEIKACCDIINDSTQFYKSSMELTLLKEIGIGCQVPLGMYSEIDGDEIELRLFLSNGSFSKALIDKKKTNLSSRIKMAKEWGKECFHWLQNADA